MNGRRRSHGFTIVELLVVIAIIATLVGLLVPAIGSAREQALVSKSEANMRQLAIAHATYAGAWNDRQFTLINDGLSTYGPNSGAAFDMFHVENGGCEHEEDAGCHPPVVLGWRKHGNGEVLWGMYMKYPSNHDKVQPIVFNNSGFGAFRIPNAQQFAQYLGGRFYDPVFYAPKDRVVTSFVEPAEGDPGQYTIGATTLGTVGWSSYCLSPAAMFNEDVMSYNPDFNGGAGGYFTDPWSTPGGFRSPSMAAARYPELKTHMLEHHWLQPKQRAECNPSGGSTTIVFESCNTGMCFTVYHDSYDDCEPYYFNASFESVPVTLFYDGHVEGLGTREAMSADARAMTQTGHGLWSRDTPWGEDGYFSEYAYDWTTTSFHILTLDGIKGRDTISQ